MRLSLTLVKISDPELWCLSQGRGMICLDWHPCFILFLICNLSIWLHYLNASAGFFIFIAACRILSYGKRILSCSMKDRVPCSGMLSCFSRVWLFVTPWTVTHQAHPPMGFSRQEYRSQLPCPPPGDLPDPGIKPVSLKSPRLSGRFFTEELYKKRS